MKLHIVTHESFEAPGAVEEWARRKGHGISHTRTYQGDALPQSISGIDLLVVMGGPQSPSTTTRECPHFDVRKETAFIRKAIDAGKMALGVCLGAQLIGEALGARFAHSPHREIGVFELTLTPDAEGDPIFSAFPKRFLVGHWHGDMPGLTPESKVLATSEGCPRQIVRYSPKVYGFQCHFEFTRETIEGMIDSCGDELTRGEDTRYVQTAATLRAHDYDAINQRLFAFLDHLEDTHRREREAASAELRPSR